jgi:pyruvate,orthophosphate dikinase
MATKSNDKKKTDKTKARASAPKATKAKATKTVTAIKATKVVKTTKAASKVATKLAAKPAAKVNKGKEKHIYEFGKKTDGNATMKALLGGKGANLAEMSRIKLPVPAGFTITTKVCNFVTESKGQMPTGFAAEMKEAIKNVEKQQAKQFGDSSNPLLFSVRSGARDSMPGMMDTILNLGLNDLTVEGLAKKTNNERFAYDCYRRFIQMYGDVVMGVQPRHENEHEPFDEIFQNIKKAGNVTEDSELTAAQLKEVIKGYKQLNKTRTKSTFPQDVNEQLQGAIGAVFKSWNNDRAIVYRQKYGIPHEWGTAVNVQAMVFGNMGDDCATGVAFTRDPANGEKIFYGDFVCAQGCARKLDHGTHQVFDGNARFADNLGSYFMHNSALMLELPDIGR